VRIGRQWKYVGTKTHVQLELAVAFGQDVSKPAREKRPYADVKVLFYYAWGSPNAKRALLQSWAYPSPSTTSS
jgi:hypothetical protein